MKSFNANEESHHVQLMIFICLGFALYAKTFGHNFIFDDYYVILKNQDLRSIKDFVNDSYPGRPLRELSFMLDYKLFGLNPKFWHIQNCLIHSLNAWMVYVLLLSLSKSKPLAWLSSLIFMVHPIHVEVVAQTSHRKDSLCLLFMLVAFYFYVVARNRMSVPFFLIAFFSFLLALLSKQSAYAFPLIVIGYEIFFLENNLFKKIKYKYLLLSFLTIASSIILYSLYVKHFYKGSKYLLFTSNVIGDYSPEKYYLTLVNAWGFIIAKLFWPFGLSVNYMIQSPDQFLDKRLLFFVFFVFVLFFVACYSCYKSKLSLFFMLWFVVFFLPTSNLLPFTKHFVADRYLYIPSVGFCVVSAFFVKSIFKKNYKSVAVFIIAAYSLVTFNQINVWRDNLFLWENALKYNPYSSRIMMNYTLFKYSDDDVLFLENIHKAIRVNPHDPFPYNSLAGFYYKNEDHLKAIENYERFIELINAHGVAVYSQIINKSRARLVELKGIVEKKGDE